MKIRPVGGELFDADGRTDRQTDMMKLLVDFFFSILRTPLKTKECGQRRLRFYAHYLINEK